MNCEENKLPASQSVTAQAEAEGPRRPCGTLAFLKKDALFRLGDAHRHADHQTDRGPDSAGIAIYGDASEGLKMTVQSDTPETAFAGLDAAPGVLGAPVAMAVIDTHAVLTIPAGTEAVARVFSRPRRACG